jgi:ribonuclease P protein component
VLPAKARLSRRDDFALAVRRGRRVSAPGIVVHSAVPADSGADSSVLVGFIVGRSVGNAVVRNRVRRRLRHLMAVRLAELPAGSRVVVRATPAASQRTFAALQTSVDAALTHSFVPDQRT